MPEPRARRHRVAVVLGTRPEAIKMAPVVEALRRRPAVFEPFVITTSQHNLVNTNKTRHVSDGRYTVAVLPVDSTMQIPE